MSSPLTARSGSNKERGKEAINDFILIKICLTKEDLPKFSLDSFRHDLAGVKTAYNNNNL